MNPRDQAFLARHRALAAEDQLPTRGSAETIEIAAELKGETDKAWRLFDGTRTAWVPKSQVAITDAGTFAMPEWLAKDKGFI